MIDLKELRIGSHILVDGEKCEVYSLSPLGLTIRCDASPFQCVMPTEHAELQPIPLTPELLTELGFKKKVYSEGWALWNKDIDDCALGVMIRENKEPSAVLQSSTNKDPCFGYSLPTPYLPTPYLHSLENFVFMTLGKELIEE